MSSYLKHFGNKVKGGWECTPNNLPLVCLGLEAGEEATVRGGDGLERNLLCTNPQTRTCF